VADIQQFIRRVAESQGLDEKTATAATGGLLGFVRSKAPGRDFRALLGELPGAADLLSEDGDLDGELGVASGIVGALKQSGLEVGQVGGFVGQFLLFAEENLSAGLVNRILAKAPELKLLLE